MLLCRLSESWHGRWSLAWTETIPPVKREGQREAAKVCLPGVQLESGLLEDPLPTRRNPTRMMVSVSRKLWSGLSHSDRKEIPAALGHKVISDLKRFFHYKAPKSRASAFLAVLSLFLCPAF